MARTIRIRDVPETVHRTLEVRAARSGLSLADYLLGELQRLATRPTLGDLAARIRRRGTAQVAEDPAAAVRDERATRR